LRPVRVGPAVAALAQDPYVPRWNRKSLAREQLAKIYGFTELDGSQPVDAGQRYFSASALLLRLISCPCARL
jgi:hypothetical protein